MSVSFQKPVCKTFQSPMMRHWTHFWITWIVGLDSLSCSHVIGWFSGRRLNVWPNEVAGWWESWLSRKDQVGNKTGTRQTWAECCVSDQRLFSGTQLLLSLFPKNREISTSLPPFQTPHPPSTVPPQASSFSSRGSFSIFYPLLNNCCLVDSSRPCCRTSDCVSPRRRDWSHLVVRFVKSKSRRPSKSKINDSRADIGEQGGEIKPISFRAQRWTQLSPRHTTGFWLIQRHNPRNITAIVKGVGAQWGFFSFYPRDDFSLEWLICAFFCQWERSFFPLLFLLDSK